MSTLHAIVLGVLQGLTEFLPVSSSGHLQLGPWLFGWDDFAGDQDLEKAFDVAVHIGTLGGAIAYLWSDIVRYASAGLTMLVRRTPSVDGRIAWFLLATVIPAAAVGVLANDLIESQGDRIWLTAVALIGGGILLFFADRLQGERDADSFGWRDALALGLAQACALQPGVSRSGITVTVARVLRFERSDATRLVFLMGIPIIAGAGIFSFIDIGGLGGIPSEFRSAFFWGVLASGITGWLAVWGLLRFVRNHSFAIFAGYRIVIGFSVLAILATSWR